MKTAWKMVLFTDRRGSGYGGACYTNSVLDALRAEAFATVDVVGTRELPQTTLVGEIQSTKLKKIWKWLLGRTEAAFEKLPEAELLTSNRRRPYDAIVLDGSLLGVNLERIRALFPQTSVIAVFHNLEVDFIDSQKVYRRPYLIVKRRAVAIAEKKAASADVLIALHGADSRRMEVLYGRSATCLFPITVMPVDYRIRPGERRRWILFVGSLFRPNVEAVDWIYKRLAPQSPCEIVVVGKKMEELRKRFPQTAHFRIVGTCVDLGAYYRQAYAVIAPVWTGGGMKVKIAEALSYGKRVIATPHAAVGFEEAVKRGVVVLARTIEEWRIALKVEVASGEIGGDWISEWCVREFGFERCAKNLRLCVERQLRERHESAT